MHAAAFESGFDNKLIGAFDSAIANRPTRRLKSRILHMGSALLQVRQGTGQLWAFGLLTGYLAECGQDWCGACRFKLMELLV